MTSRTVQQISGVIVAVLIGSVPSLAIAQMSSGSYRVQFDSINTSGGLSSSASYQQESTVGEIATGDSSSASYAMRAGYQQMNTSFISISDGGNITLPNLSGITENTSSGSTSWTVITDSPSGYTLGVRATSTPALVNTASSTQYFTDYVPLGSDPDLVFQNPSGTARFGFNPDGQDITNVYITDGSTCNPVGGLTYDSDTSCWRGFSTSTIEIARGSSNQPAGVTTTLNVQAANGSNHIQPAGTYRAVIIATALTL